MNEKRRRGYIEEHNEALSQLERLSKEQIAKQYQELIITLWKFPRRVPRPLSKGQSPVTGSSKNPDCPKPVADSSHTDQD